LSSPWNCELFIDGKWTTGDGSNTLDVIDPATEELIGQVPEATPKDAVRAIEAARKAFDEGPWPWMKPRDRAAALVRMADALERRAVDLRELIVAETGSTGFVTDFFQAGGAIGMFRSNAEQIVHAVDWVESSPPTGGPTGMAGKAVIREPVGVVAAITPFNFPFTLNVVKSAPALAAGCTVVLKPHQWTPLDAFMIAAAAEEAGLPPGVFNVITGASEVGDELTGNPMVDMVAFTGSTATGRRIMANAAGTVKKLQLELGGKSAQVVLDDVPESYVASIGFGAVLTHAGQGCVLQTRLVLPERFIDAYKEGVIKARAAIKIGDPRDPAATMGPLIREQQRQRVESYTQSAVDEGADIIIGGKRPDGFPKGFYYEPTVYLARNDMRVAQEEIFGPCLTVVPYSGDDAEGVRIANDTIYGLGGGVVSGSISHAFNVARQIRAGSVTAQGVPTNPPVSTGPGDGQGPGWGTSMAGFGQEGAFGGYKQSGLGREWGRLGVEEFCEIKSLSWS
jgi:acyl-CoA reductase-like NAD-dependent aldehyde dehydrogenase